MNYFRVILHGAHLLAHTWASNPVQQGVLYGCTDTEKLLSINDYSHYTMKPGIRREMQGIFLKKPDTLDSGLYNADAAAIMKKEKLRNAEK